MQFLNKNSNVLYYKQIIKVRQVHDYSKYYSSLVSAPPPFNILILPFIPFIIYLKSEKLNTILMYLWYQPVLVLGITVFIATSIIHLPFAYIMLIIRQFKAVVFEGFKSWKSFLIEAGVFWLTISWGIVYILILQSIDAYYFTVTLFSNNLQRKIHQSQNERNGYSEIDSELFDILVHKIDSSTNEWIDSIDLIIYFRDRLKIFDQITNLIFNISPTSKIDHLHIPEENKKEAVNFEYEAPEYLLLLINTYRSEYHFANEKYAFHQINSKKEDKLSVKLRDLINSKTSKEIISQYIALKKFIILNSIGMLTHTKL